MRMYKLNMFNTKNLSMEKNSYRRITEIFWIWMSKTVAFRYKIGAAVKDWKIKSWKHWKRRVMIWWVPSITSVDLSLGTLSLSLYKTVPVSHYWWRWGWVIMKRFDSRTSEMQIQISARVNFYALLLKKCHSILCFSLSICFFVFLFLFFSIAYYHFCGIKLWQVSSFMVIFSTQ